MNTSAKRWLLRGLKYYALTPACNKCRDSESFNTVTLWFWEIAEVKGGAAMKRPSHSALLKSTTSFVNVANKKWNTESRFTDANNKLTWLWCFECKHLWANICCLNCCNWIATYRISTPEQNTTVFWQKTVDLKSFSTKQIYKRTYLRHVSSEQMSRVRA